MSETTKFTFGNNHTAAFATLDFLGLEADVWNPLYDAGFTGVHTAIDYQTRLKESGKINSKLSALRGVGFDDFTLIPFWSAGLFNDPNPLDPIARQDVLKRAGKDVGWTLSDFKSGRMAGPCGPGELWQNQCNNKLRLSATDEQFEAVLPLLVEVAVEIYNGYPDLEAIIEFLSNHENFFLTTPKRARIFAQAVNKALKRRQMTVLYDTAHGLSPEGSAFETDVKPEMLYAIQRNILGSVCHVSAPLTRTNFLEYKPLGLAAHPKLAEMEAWLRFLINSTRDKTFVIEIFPKDDFLKAAIGVNGVDPKHLVAIHVATLKWVLSLVDSAIPVIEPDENWQDDFLSA